MKKRTYIRNVIVFGLFGLFFCSCDSPKREPPTISTRKLMSDFMTDAYGAENKYEFYIIRLTGKIGRIEIKESPHYVNQWEYTLRMQPERIEGTRTEVFCHFDRSQASQLQDLSEGDRVKISGRLWQPPVSFSLEAKQGVLQRGTYSNTGGTYYYVRFYNCRLVKETTP